MNNEEKILAMLEKLTEEVGRHGDLLEKQGNLLEKHSEIQEKHTEILEKHSEMLAKQDETLAKHGEMLARHDGTLEKLVNKVDRQGELLEEIDGRSLRSAVMLENEVLPKLQLLYEGHVHLQETLAPKAQVETLEGEVVTLKSAVKMMTKRLEALEEAKVLDSFRKADAAYSRHLAASRMFSYLLMDVESVLVCVSTFFVVSGFSLWLLPGAVLGVLPHLLIDVLNEKRRSGTYREQSGKRRRLRYLWQLFCTKEPVKEMRTMGFAGFLKEKWVGANVEVVREMEELELKAIRLSAAGVMLKNLSYVANVAIALLLMVRGGLAVGQFAACLTAFGLLQDNLSMLSEYVARFLQSWHHVEEYYDFFRAETEKEGEED